VALHRAQQLHFISKIFGLFKAFDQFQNIPAALSGAIHRFFGQSSWLAQCTNYSRPVIASKFLAISFFLSKSCKIWKAILLCSSAQALFSPAFAVNFVGCRKFFSSSFAKAVKVKSVPTMLAGGRFATHRLRAFFRSKTLSVSSVGSRGNPPLKQAVGKLSLQSSLG